MKMKMIGLAAVTLLSAGALAQTNTTTRLFDGKFGISAGAYFPQSAALREAFDDAILSVGFQVIDDRFEDRWKFKPDLSLIRAERRGNDLTVAILSFGAGRSFGKSESSTPYVQGGVGLAYFDYDFVAGGTSYNDSRLGWATHVEAGVIMNQSLKLSARYNFLSKQSGVNFSGLELTLSYGFFRL